MNAIEAAQCITLALAALPQQAAKLDPDAVTQTAKSWAWLMDDLDAKDVGAAVKRHLATSEWLPTPAQIRRIVHEAKHGRRRPGADAWGDVLSEVGRTGRYRQPVFTDPVVARCVDALGWVRLCDSENAIADRARFVELYDRLAAADAEDRSVASLPGVARPALLPARTGPTSLGAAILHALPSETPDA